MALIKSLTNAGYLDDAPGHCTHEVELQRTTSLIEIQGDPQNQKEYGSIAVAGYQDAHG